MTWPWAHSKLKVLVGAFSRRVGLSSCPQCFSPDDSHSDHVVVLRVFTVVAFLSHTLMLEACLLVGSYARLVVAYYAEPDSVESFFPARLMASFTIIVPSPRFWKESCR